MKSFTGVTIFAALSSAAPLLLAPLIENENAVPGEFIVSFKDGHNLQLHEQVIGRVMQSLIRYNWNEVEHVAPFGYTGKFDDLTLALIRADPMVDFVEQDYYFSTPSETVSALNGAENGSAAALSKRVPTQQNNADYNLDIVSHNGKRDSGNTFNYDSRSTGTNVDLYIVDSGINIDHEEFGGRATNFFDATETTFRDESETAAGDGSVIYGHGTQVADVAGGNIHGVAKTANLLSVKIATGPNKSGRGSDAVTGIKRINRRHNTRKTEGNFRGSVVNYSVDIPIPTQNRQSLGLAVSAADADNIIQVAAAGNSNDEAINHLPAAYTEVITVASMTELYSLSQSTSYGTSVDIIAPGTGITAAQANTNNGYSVVSGTSFAAPLVAGVCAQFMSYADGPQTKMDLYNMLIDFSLKDLVNTQNTNTPNRLINNGANTRSWPPRDELKAR